MSDEHVGERGNRLGTPRGVLLRWTLVAVVLVVAATVAVWPRGGGADPARPTPASAPSLAEMRATADLRPCPEPAEPTGAGEPAGRLAGVLVPCLGAAGTVDVGAALAGEPALLNVWAHTCEPCRHELPVLDEYDLRDDSVRVLAIQVDGSQQAGLGMLAALGVRLPSVADPDNTLRAALSAPPVLPLNFVVWPDGRVRMVNPPIVFETADEVAGVVAEHFGEAAP